MSAGRSVETRRSGGFGGRIAGDRRVRIRTGADRSVKNTHVVTACVLAHPTPFKLPSV